MKINDTRAPIPFHGTPSNGYATRSPASTPMPLHLNLVGPDGCPTPSHRSPRADPDAGTDPHVPADADAPPSHADAQKT